MWQHLAAVRSVPRAAFGARAGWAALADSADCVESADCVDSTESADSAESADPVDAYAAPPPMKGTASSAASRSFHSIDDCFTIGPLSANPRA
jgi:hypothetical protein